MMNQGESLRLAGKAAALLVFCLFSAVADAGSTTYNVRANGDIQTAIDAASNGDIIQLAAGTYNITTTIDPAGKQVTIIGTVDGNGDPTSILDGGNPVGGTSGVRVLICQNSETSATVFENLVIQNGYSSSDGGGMYNTSSSPTLTNCTFTSNSASASGGGMRNVSSSSPTLTNCTFTDNLAAYGGGMRNVSSSSPTLTDCTFTSNSADIGGGMYNSSSSSSPTLTNCTFTECCQVDPPRSFVDGGGNDYESWCDDCRADVNCRDDAVNAADLGILIGVWGTSDPQSDINGDGTVNAADLGILLGAWGPCQ